MFLSTKKIHFIPPIVIFLLLLQPENANYYVLRLIFIITYLYSKSEKK